jgi:hypothetical protein
MIAGALAAFALTYTFLPHASVEICPLVAPVILRTYERAPPPLSLAEPTPAPVLVQERTKEQNAVADAPAVNATAWPRALKGAPTLRFEGTFAGRY